MGVEGLGSTELSSVCTGPYIRITAWLGWEGTPSSDHSHPSAVGRDTKPDLSCPSTPQTSSAGGGYAWKVTGKIPSDKHKAANTDPCPLELQ